MQPSRPRLTVVAPVYNEAEVIATFYRELRSVLDTLALRYESTILFVADRSTDSTLDVLRSIASLDSSVQVLSLSSRFGHQMSLLAGIDNAGSADVIVMMDSDLQHPPAIINDLLAKHAQGHDIVYTRRIATESTGVLRRVFGMAFYRLLRAISNVPIYENAADFRLITKRVADVVRTDIRERNLFLRGIFSWIGFNQSSVEFVAPPRGAGRSKYSVSRMVRLAIAAILSFSTKPLQIGIFVGLTFAAFSALLMMVTVVEYFRDATIPSGWTTIVTLLLLFNGVQMIIMGILGAYIGGIYEEVKGRPHYIVEERINIGAGGQKRVERSLPFATESMEERPATAAECSTLVASSGVLSDARESGR